MGKSQKNKGAAFGPASTGADEPYRPDASFQPVSIEQPKMDTSDAGLGGDQELWLLQLPVDFPAGARVQWEISEDPHDGFRGRCTVEGVDYLMVPEEEALNADLFATPSSAGGSVAKLARRMTVVRASAAPRICFGQSDAEAAAAGSTAPGAAVPAAKLPPPDKKALKRKHAAQQQAVPAPVAPRAPPPPAAPAAATKSGQAAPGAEGPLGSAAAAAGGTPAAAAAAAADGGDAGKKSSKKKRKADGEAAEGGSGKKKDKSAKKEKKKKEEKKHKKEKD